MTMYKHKSPTVTAQQWVTDADIEKIQKLLEPLGLTVVYKHYPKTARNGKAETVIEVRRGQDYIKSLYRGVWVVVDGDDVLSLPDVTFQKRFEAA